MSPGPVLAQSLPELPCILAAHYPLPFTNTPSSSSPPPTVSPSTYCQLLPPRLGAGPGLRLASCCWGRTSTGCLSKGCRTAGVLETAGWGSTTNLTVETIHPPSSCSLDRDIQSCKGRDRELRRCREPFLWPLTLLAQFSPYLGFERSWDLSCWDSGIWRRGFV